MCIRDRSGTGPVDNLEFVEARAFVGGPPPATTRFTGKIPRTPVGGNTVWFSLVINPQPECEMIKVENTSGSAITIASGTLAVKTICVPTTTTYGIIILVLLLLASTVYVMRRKRAGEIA